MSATEHGFFLVFHKLSAFPEEVNLSKSDAARLALNIRRVSRHYIPCLNCYDAKDPAQVHHFEMMRMDHWDTVAFQHGVILDGKKSTDASWAEAVLHEHLLLLANEIEPNQETAWQ